MHINELTIGVITFYQQSSGCVREILLVRYKNQIKLITSIPINTML